MAIGGGTLPVLVRQAKYNITPAQSKPPTSERASDYRRSRRFNVAPAICTIAAPAPLLTQNKSIMCSNAYPFYLDWGGSSFPPANGTYVVQASSRQSSGPST